METLTLEYQTKSVLNFHISDDEKLSWIGNFDSRSFKRFFVVIDENVYKLWGEKIVKRLQEHGKEIFIFQVKPEEYTKSIDFYPNILRFFEEHNCSRFDLVMGVGGGIVLDLVSFFCSTYMRGLHFYAIPTTLIGQVDAITAGKTCLNTSNGKNVLGTFYYPEEVYNNMAILKTNKPYYERQGFSEIFKYGLLASRPLLEALDLYFETKADEDLMEVVRLTIEARSLIRKKDPLASNLGHTFGHAIEKISNYQILHGDAIAVGTVMALHFAQREGLVSGQFVERISGKMRELGLNVYLDKQIDIDLFVKYMLCDKKSSVDSINLVLLLDVEKPYEKNGELFYGVTPEGMREFLRKFVDEYEYCVENAAEFIKKDQL